MVSLCAALQFTTGRRSIGHTLRKYISFLNYKSLCHVSVKDFTRNNNFVVWNFRIPLLSKIFLKP